MQEFLEKQLERTNYWLAFAEAKNTALIAINIALIAVLADYLSITPIIATVIEIAFVISSIICGASFCPKLSPVKAMHGEGQNLNLIFYGDIARCKDSNDYLDKVHNRYFVHGDANAYKIQINKDLAYEIFQNSIIAVGKYQKFKLAVIIDIIGFCFVIFMMIMA